MQDRDEALALAVYRQQQAEMVLCPCGCGHPVAETTSHYEAGPEYDAVHITCRARAAIVEAQDAAAERKQDTRAWLWSVRKTGR